MLGLRKGEVSVIPYEPLWRDAYRNERDALTSAFPSHILAISHGGSTSVEGMAAKPIIDVFVALRSLDEHLQMRPALEGMGYEYQGEDGVPGREFYLKVRDSVGTHHLQLMTLESLHWENHLALREYYRAHPAVRDEYSALKSRLALQFPLDRVKYSAAKKDFVNVTLARAQEWYRAQAHSLDHSALVS